MEEFELPETQTQEQEDFVESSQIIEIRRPWGRLCACLATLKSVDLFEPYYTFGRAPGCNIVVEEEQFPSILNISKIHFALEKEDDVIYITDLSKNGTFVNNTKVGRNNRHIVYNDDTIAIGLPNSKIYSLCCNINREDYPKALIEKYFVSKKIGRGAFGEVRLAHNKCTCERFAIKRIHKGRSSSSAIGRVSPPEKIKTEIEILTSFSYAFIIRMREVFETDREVFLVLEYMGGGELTKRIVSAASFPESEVKHVFYQIALAIRYLHLNGITHRDLKPENVLLVADDPYPMVKVADFGLSKILDDVSLMETVCGTINYAAPEVLNSCERYTKKVDIWSAGVILFYMLTKSQPFIGPNRDAIARTILGGKIGWESRAWKGISASAKDITRRMLLRDPEQRMSTTGIFRHEWIEKDTSMKYKVEQLTLQSFEETDDSSEDFFRAAKRPRYNKSGDGST